MSERLDVYKCQSCGVIVEVIDGGTCPLVCCGDEMKLRAANTEDAAQEKHVPVIEKTAEGIKVTVGSVPHPMTPEHWIEFIELLADGKVYRQYLSPDDAPSAVFCLKADQVTAREYCNLHGLWKA
jgi:superoxide reductase